MARKFGTHCLSGRHEFTPENTRLNAKGQRQCRACSRERDNAAAKRRRAELRGLSEAELIPHINVKLRYWPRVRMTDDCWMWTGQVDGAGYGYVYFRKKPVSVHRIAYSLVHGAIPPKHEICHSCDVPLCVNPAHLFAATHAENMRDMRAKGRHPGFVTT